MKISLFGTIYALFISSALVSNAAEARANLAVSIRDPADQLFRRAPMSAAARSIAIPLSSNLNFAFDAELVRVHTVWSGPSLNLLGPPYTGKKFPFICTFDGTILWGTPPFCPWSIGENPPATDSNNFSSIAHFRGLDTKTGNVTLLYEILVNGKSISIRETPQAGEGNFTVIRHFEIAPCDETLWFLAHAEMGNFGAGQDSLTVVIQREKDAVSFVAEGYDALRWQLSEREVDYQVERITEEGTVRGNPRDLVHGHQSRAYLKIPSHAQEVSFDIATTVGEKNNPQRLAIKPFVHAKTFSKARIFSGDLAAQRPPSGDEFFRIEHFPLPKEMDLLVSGMDWLPDGRFAVCSWPGEIYLVEDAQGPVEKATYRRFARGLNEPMGLKVVNGQIYVAQKAELTRISDTDGNGEADFYETVNADWGYSGSYDSFAFGPALDKAGNFFIAIEGSRGRWDVSYMGWAVKISPDGKKLSGISSGLRAPNGIASFGPDADIFVSDNQGEWIGACKLNHLQPGKFFGYPSTSPAPREAAPKTFDPPAIWFPRKWSPSTSDLAEIRDPRFGPFLGQLIVGDFQNALFLRVQLEKVDGEWQGAVFPFARGFFSGVNRLSFGPDGKLYVGGCQRAWASTVPQAYSLDRVFFTGKIPFEIQEVHAQRDGLELSFTEPVDAASAEKIDNYDISQFNYIYHRQYGSPEIDYDGKENSSSSVPIQKVTISADGKKVKLFVNGWRPGYVTEVHCLDLKSVTGKPLHHDSFYYTLNRIPK